MKNFKDSEVYSYLSHLDHFLNGDLKTFHKVCKEVESVFIVMPESPITGSNSLINNNLQENKSTATVTLQTTMYPKDVANNNSLLTPEDQNQFRLTIPITLSLFSTIDCVGNLLSKIEKPTDSNMNCLNHFLSYSKILVTDDEKKLLIDVFRNGLSHVYFPKLSLGISYHSSNPIEKLFFKDEKGNLILNVNRLEEIVVKTFKSIIENESLYSEMENRYQKLKSKYKKEHENAIKDFNP